MDNKFFGIDPDQRSTIPSAKRATGFSATQEPFEYINQALFELKTDHVIGTAAQLALNQCTCKYQSSDQTLRDGGGTAVTLSDGDRVYIIGLDTLTADFDLSAYDRLRVVGDPSVTLANSSQDLLFGDETYIDIIVALESGIVPGQGIHGYFNRQPISGSTGDIGITGKSAAPLGSMICDGSAISRTTYSNLFVSIGTTWGVGDGSTTFNIPNGQGLGITGAGTQTINGNVKGKVSGVTSVLGDTVEDAMQDHTHGTKVAYENSYTEWAINIPTYASSGSPSTGAHILGGVDEWSTYGAARSDMETKISSIVVNFIIKY